MKLPNPGELVTIIVNGFTWLYENNYVLYGLVVIIFISLALLLKGCVW